MDYRTLLFVLILLAPYANALAVDTINVAIDDKGFVSVNETVTLYGSKNTEDYVLIPGKVDVTSVSSSINDLIYNITSSENLSNITLRFPALNSGEHKEVSIAYTSKYLTSKTAGAWLLNLRSCATAYRTVLKISFPTNTTILSWEPKWSFSPGKDLLYLYPESDDFELNVTYEYADSGAITPLGEEPSNIFVPILLLVILVLAYHLMVRRRRTEKARTSEMQEIRVEHKPLEAVVATVEDVDLTHKPQETLVATMEEIKVNSKASEPEKNKTEEKTAKKRKVKESILNVLDENERRIISILEAAGDEITQAQICRETGIPKASLSDILRHLEKRNVVERERDGRRNWIKIKEWVFE